ncbi:MAG: DUF305 domain-containing protein [Gemmatimonadetes bacterium]|nr:DUF305 domain-containing protein [Gemmatimonadota bacterium]
MTRTRSHSTFAAIAALAIGAISTAGAQGTKPATASPANSYVAKARADSARLPYTEADVFFMQGMISHHAQAIIMAKWAATHGASPAVQTLCGRIINAQNDEIVLMQTWLRDRNQTVPEAKPAPMKMKMGGMVHEMMMPGMLTDEQMKQLDAARGTEFDRLFLTGMIQHHKGAVTMVKDLFATDGAANDELTFKFASDVNVDQTTEIARMEKMLTDVVLGVRTP